MIREFDIAVVGAGAAGLAAAAEAARLGRRVALIDDNARPGGNYFRHPPAALGAGAHSTKDRARLEALLAAAAHPLVTHLPGATVWDVPEPLTLAVAADAQSCRVRARAVVLATGARDRAVPFTGWTLPGVISAGGLQNMVKGLGVAPGGPAVVAGNGPLLLLAAASLVRAGVRVAVVAEAAPVPRRLVRELARLAWGPEIVRLAIGYAGELRRAGIRIRYGTTVIAALGRDRLEAVNLAGIAPDGSIDRNHVLHVPARTLVTGFGLVPSLELPRLMGAALEDAPLRGGTTLVRNARLMTSLPGVFAAGDGASIGGVELALAEGRTAGIEAALAAGAEATRQVHERLAALDVRRSRLDRFRRGLEALYAPPDSWLGLMTPDTIVCRCEDVRLADIARRQAEGARTATQLKPPTRIGMGRCQGRNCLGTLVALIAASTGTAQAGVPMPRARPPARPIRLGDLLYEDIPPPALPDDPHLPRQR